MALRVLGMRRVTAAAVLPGTSALLQERMEVTTVAHTVRVGYCSRVQSHDG
jgi:hypothetical protein